MEGKKGRSKSLEREKRDKERIHGEVEDGAKRRDELAREGAWRLLVESHFKNGGG